MLGRGPDRMKRGCFRVSPIGTDVMGIGVARGLPLARCVSAADTRLSLSLSLSTPGLLGSRPSFGVFRGARRQLLDRPRRGCARGFFRSLGALVVGGGR